MLFTPSIFFLWLFLQFFANNLYHFKLNFFFHFCNFWAIAGDQGGIVEALIGHTVFALGFSRVFELIFWLGSFKELADASGKAKCIYQSLIITLN